MCKCKEGNTMECKCNKELCCKMQKKSLQYAISSLKNNEHDRFETQRILKAIHSLLTVYSCLPGICLLKRIEEVQEHMDIYINSLYEYEKLERDMLIIELEIFLDSTNS